MVSMTLPLSGKPPWSQATAIFIGLYRDKCDFSAPKTLDADIRRCTLIVLFLICENLRSSASDYFFFALAVVRALAFGLGLEFDLGRAADGRADNNAFALTRTLSTVN